MDQGRRSQSLALFLGLLLVTVVAVRLYSEATSKRYSLRNSLAPAIDLNQADVLDLVQLPGIEHTLALRIIQEREQRGPFINGQDFCHRVDGIGAAKLEQILKFAEITEPQVR